MSQRMERFVHIMEDTRSQRVKENQRPDITFQGPVSVTLLDHYISLLKGSTVSQNNVTSLGTHTKHELV